MPNLSSRHAAALTACAILLVCAACTSNPIPTPTATATATPLPTSHLNTHEGPVEQATLPPSWTPTHTQTLSRTPTPTPITPTATATPVPNLADLCASFTVDVGFADGRIFLWDDTITLMFGTPFSLVRDPATDAAVPVLVRFMATHTETGETLGVQGAGGQTHIMQLAASCLVNPGHYTWKVVVYNSSFGEQCAHEGDLYVYPASEDIPATAEATEAS